MVKFAPKAKPGTATVVKLTDVRKTIASQKALTRAQLSKVMGTLRKQSVKTKWSLRF